MKRDGASTGKLPFLSPGTGGRERGETIIFFFPIAVIAGFAVIKFGISFDWYRWIVREDGPVENITALVYGLAFLLALSATVVFYRGQERVPGGLYALFSAGLFTMCMEEISWGQRIFGVQSPEFFRHYNDQQEINLHNFFTRYYLHAFYIVVGFYGSFGSRLLSPRIRGRFSSLMRLIVFDRCLFFYFFPVFAFYLYFDHVSRLEISLFGAPVLFKRYIHAKDQEPAELLLSLGFLLFTAINRYRQSAGPARRRATVYSLPLQEPKNDHKRNKMPLLR
ncbi:MAG: hypothetical protein K8I29_00995 [Alphaproteobacteria bacterium]|uniref:Uncharacterized protein n=1 Tax=Candidatus Nitrobium versatile TaxID=2884831 RepID=A0A953LYV0_9BACT|nr:hypothetical protein [Candidatus Nitrobium versatile]